MVILFLVFGGEVWQLQDRNMTHSYQSLASFERLLLLVSAIAQNPGIANQRQTQQKNRDPMDILQDAMAVIAQKQGIEFDRWSSHTIRADLKTLRQYGILPSGTVQRGGYRLNQQQEITQPTKTKTRSKSKLTPAQMRQLQQEGASLRAIAEKSGVSRERVRQILNGE